MHKTLTAIVVLLITGAPFLAHSRQPAPVMTDQTASLDAPAHFTEPLADNSVLATAKNHLLSPHSWQNDWAYPLKDPFKTIPARNDAELLQYTARILGLPDGTLLACSNDDEQDISALAISPDKPHQPNLSADSANSLLPATTQNPTPKTVLTFEQALNIALCRNAEIRQSWLAIQSAAANLGQAQSAYLPTMQAGISRIRQSSVTGHPLLPYSLNYATSKNISVNWRVFDFGARSSREKAASHQLQSAFASQRAQAQKLIKDLAEQYFDFQGNQMLYQSRQEILQLHQQNLASAQARVAKGAADQAEILQALSAQARTNLELSKARGELEKSQALLAYTLGLAQHADFEAPSVAFDDKAIEKQLQQFEANLTQTRDTNHLPEKIERHHPAVLAAQAQLVAAEESLKMTKAEGMPTVDISLNQYQNGRPNQSIASGQSRERTAAISLNVPLFDGFNTSYKVQSALAQVEQRQIELERTKAEVRKEALQIHAEAKAAWANLQAARGLLLAATEATQSMQRKYKAGAANLMQLNTSINDRLQADLELNSAAVQLEKIRFALILR